MKRTIKFRILSYNLLIICMIGLIFSVSSYVTANRKAIEASQNSLVYHVDSITGVYEIAYGEMRNILINCTEGNMFDLGRVGSLSTLEQKRIGLDYAKSVGNFCAVTGYGEYISRLSIFDVDGFHISAGTVPGSFDDAAKLLETDWFWREIEKDMNYYRLDLVDSPFYRESGKLLPIICRSQSRPKESWVAIFLSPRLYENELKKNDSGNEMLVVTYEGERVAALHEEAENREENDGLIRSITEQKEDSGLLHLKVHGKESMMAYRREPASGIITIEILDMELLKSDRLLLIQTVVMIFAACVALGVMLSVFFSRTVQRPIDNLVAHIGHVARGEFHPDASIESEDEIGKIGKVLNVMSGQIDRLMKKRLEDEKEKSALELKMLQAQINPHFLYNTLDSIRWIAVIQKNSGIVKAVTALSKLLKNMAKGFHEKITVREELDFVNDYVIIEKLKYAEMFDVKILVDDPRLYKARIVKLTLQPLVENAIFSGIEPTGRNGVITIHVYEEEGCLILTVKDDGAGIPEEKINGLLEENENLKGDRMSSIGIANVNRRIKLIYGDAYGLSVESRLACYTKVIIRVPLEYGAEAKNQEE